MTNKKYYYAVWRRKTSTAVTHLFKGKGNILIRKDDEYVSIEDYFTWQGSEDLLKDALYPFTVLWKTVRNQLDATIHLSGWWLRWHSEAIRHSLSRALVEFDNDFRTVLKPYGLLKRDPREKERKKPGLRKARKAPQWSKR